MKIRLFLAPILALLFWNCHGQTKNVQNITPNALSEALKSDPGLQLIDVRTPEEFAGGHIGPATNIDWNGDRFEQSVAKLDKNQSVYVYCKIGGRSAKAADKLASMGFTKVYNLDGGILKWDAAGLSAVPEKTIGMARNEFDKRIASDQKVLVNFYAKWCAPCQRMAPYMEPLGAQYKGRVTVIRLDADEHKTLLRELKIDALPVTVLYENGKPVWRKEGFVSEKELKKQLP